MYLRPKTFEITNPTQTPEKSRLRSNNTMLANRILDYF
jgi:hypothetical protein